MPDSTPTVESVRRAANVLRGLAMDAVQRANSGHPGMPMGMADVATTLWLRHLRYDPARPEWRGRDRFVLSAGHGSMLLYGLLHLAGFDLPLDELRNFRQLHSKTPGHPEFGHTPGVETTTGPLGQGFGNGVGLALGAKLEAAWFGHDALARRVFGIVSDGDLMEGVSQEAASLAGHLALDNLVYLYDDNGITIDGSTEIAWNDDVSGRFAALGWRVLDVDGHDLEAIAAVLDEAVVSDGRPTLVRCRTHIGFGSPNKVDTSGAHGAPLGVDEVAATKQALGLPVADEFWIPDDVTATFTAAAEAKRADAAAFDADVTAWAKADPNAAARREAFLSGATPDDLLDDLLATVAGKAAATRALSGTVLQRAAELVPGLVTGSADLDSSCKTNFKASSLVTAADRSGRNIAFGIREHAMGSIANGLVLWGGFRPLVSTFLVFSDYMRPAIRLAAIMGLPATFVFTHDSLMVGEDGPTHQPVEHAAALRLIPHLHVLRPADADEVAAAWAHAIQRRNGPTALLLTRQGLPAIERPASFSVADFARGARVVREAAQPRATLIASGSEVATAIDAAERLAADGIDVRVVSAMCLELLRDASRAERDALLPPDQPTFAVEMGRPEPWYEWTGGRPERVIGLERFGTSAPAAEVAEQFGFTGAAVAEFVRRGLDT